MCQENSVSHGRHILRDHSHESGPSNGKQRVCWYVATVGSLKGEGIGGISVPKYMSKFVEGTCSVADEYLTRY